MICKGLHPESWLCMLHGLNVAVLHGAARPEIYL